MRTLTITAIVGPDHTLTVSVPVDIPPGPRQVVIVLEEPVPALSGPRTLTFAPHLVGLTDPNFTFRREDLYGDDGR